MQHSSIRISRPLGSMAICIVILVSRAMADQGASFLRLGPTAEGAVPAVGTGISGDGLTVVGFANGSDGRVAYRWTSLTGPMELGRLPGGQNWIQANAASFDGSVIVGEAANNAGDREAFRWTAATGLVGLGRLPGGGSYHSTAKATSMDGRVVVGQSNANSLEGFRWTAEGGMQRLGLLPGGKNSDAFDVSADGSVVVGSATRSGGLDRPTRWTAETGWVELGAFPGGNGDGEAYAISSDGTYTVGITKNQLGGYDAARWSVSGEVLNLGRLPGSPFGYNFSPLDVSDDGRVIVGYADAGAHPHAIIWDPLHGVRDLNEILVYDYGIDLSGLTLEFATSVSNDGRTITGGGIGRFGVEFAWVVVIPEPSGFIFLVWAVALMLPRLNKHF